MKKDKAFKNKRLPHYPLKESKEELFLQTDNLVKEPSFVRCYVEDLTSLTEKHDERTKLLYTLLKRMNSTDNTVALPPDVRNSLLTEIGIKQSSYYKHMKVFIAYGYILRSAKCVYVLNPHLFYKGLWNNAKKARKDFIELRIKYDRNTGAKTVMLANNKAAKIIKTDFTAVKFTQLQDRANKKIYDLLKYNKMMPACATELELIHNLSKKYFNSNSKPIKIMHYFEYMSAEIPRLNLKTLQTVAQDDDVAQDADVAQDDDVTHDAVEQIPITASNAIEIAEKLFAEFAAQNKLLEKDMHYVCLHFMNIAEQLRKGEIVLKSKLTIRTYSNYLYSTFLSELKKINANSDKTVYKPTYERLTDYSWAEGLDS